jgi:hypothetical protein
MIWDRCGGTGLVSWLKFELGFCESMAVVFWFVDTGSWWFCMVIWWLRVCLIVVWVLVILSYVDLVMVIKP